MSDAPLAESRAFNLHSAGTDLVEGSALAIKSASGAVTVDGFAETTINVLGVGGGTAHDAVDAGYPQKIGGKATFPGVPSAVSNSGDRVDAWFMSTGSLAVSAVDSVGAQLTYGNPNDGLGAAGSTRTLGFGMVYDGSVYNRMRQSPNATGAVAVGGPTISDAALVVSPLTIGGRASNATPTAMSADGDVVDAWLSRSGAQVVGGFDGTTSTHFRTTDAFVTAAASPTTGIVAAMAPDRRYSSVNLGTVIGNTQAWDVNGADTVLVYVGTSTTGTFTFEVSADGTNYVSAETRDTAVDLWVSGTNLTPTSGKVYRIVTNGWRSVRAKTVATLGGVVAMTSTLAAHSTVVNAIDTGPAPHAFGYPSVWKRLTASSAQTGTAIWTPASGRRIRLTQLKIGVGGTTAGTCTVWFGATADTTYTGGTDQPVFEHEFAPTASLKPGVIDGNGGGLIGDGAIDDVLRLTTTNALTITVLARGYETP